MKYFVAYVVTDVKRTRGDIEDGRYDVTVDEVNQWRLTGLPVRWQHAMPRDSSHRSAIFTPEGIGTVKNWWLDKSSKWKPFAVAVLLEIFDADFLLAPTIDRYRCVSMSYLASDHTRCVEISLVRTGKRAGTAGIYVPAEALIEVCEAFGFPVTNEYKRVGFERFKTAVMETPPTIAKPNGEPANADGIDESASAMNELMKEAESLNAVLKAIPPTEAENVMKIINDRDKRAEQFETSIDRRLECWSVQLKDILDHLSDCVDGQCDLELKKRKDDVEKLRGQLKNIDDVWQKFDLVSASFDTVRDTVGSAYNRQTRAAKDLKRLMTVLSEKWPRGGDKVNDHTKDEDVNKMVDRFIEAHRRDQERETVHNLKGQVDDYYKCLETKLGLLKQTAPGSRKRSVREDPQAEQLARSPKRIKQHEEKVDASFVTERPTAKTSSFNYWQDRRY